MKRGFGAALVAGAFVVAMPSARTAEAGREPASRPAATPARPPAAGAAPAGAAASRPTARPGLPARPPACTPVGAGPLGDSVPAEKILKDLHDGKIVNLKGVVVEGNLDADLEWPAATEDRRAGMRIVTGGLHLESCRIAGRISFRRAVFLQALELPCSEVRGDLDLADADLPALLAQRVHVIGPVRLGGLQSGGEVDLTGAVLEDRLEAGGRVRGDIRLSNAELHGGAEFARLISEGLDLSFLHAAGPVRLADALLLGDFSATSGAFGRGLTVDGARAEGDADLDEATAPAGVSLTGLAVSGDLTVSVAGGSPLALTDVQVGGDLSLFDGRVGSLLMDRLTVRGSTEFESCRISGKATLRDADFGRDFTAEDTAFLGDSEFHHVRFPGHDPMAGARFARAPSLVDTVLPVPPTIEGDEDGSADDDLDFQDVDPPDKH